MEDKGFSFEVRWSRDDVLDAINRSCGTRLERDGANAVEVEELIDQAAAMVGDWFERDPDLAARRIVDMLISQDTVERAYELEVQPDPQAEPVRDWYMANYGSDALGAMIDPGLTFGDALAAVSLGSGFYDVLGAGDSLVRERVFAEIADRVGVSYDDVYDAWLEMRPVRGIGGAQRDPIVGGGRNRPESPER